eukprot:3290859-Rhodomonas_salina.1
MPRTATAHPMIGLRSDKAGLPGRCARLEAVPASVWQHHEATGRGLERIIHEHSACNRGSGGPETVPS